EFYAEWTQDFHNSIGTFCSGGTVANITGLWVARNRLLAPAPASGFAGIAEDGLAAGLRHYGYDGLAVLGSRRGHYSLRKAADLLGLGRRQLVAVPVDAHHKVDLKALRAEAAALRQRRYGIVALVGIAGTTETGNVDDLDAMADIAAELDTH